MTTIADKYEVIRELGQGSTGKVYLVKHRELAARYALKLLNRVLSADQGFIERFKREAEVMQSFSHPGSIRLHDFGRTSEGLYYMTMDYSDGQLLKDIVDTEGPMPILQVLEIMVQLLDVLDAAHQAGVVHRDIKPDNVMVEGLVQGRMVVKILDFGIARLKAQVDLDSPAVMDGASMGTPCYMSPEQASGEQVLDHRVDIYSAGVLMYELLSGKVPFSADTVVQTLLLHIMKPPPSFNKAQAVPPIVERVVLRALEKNREARFQTAHDFKLACERALYELKSDPSLNMSRAIARQIQNAEIKESKTPPPPPPQPKSDGTKEPTTILCLDDDQMILNILSFVLEKAGYAVITTTESSMAHHYLFHNEIKLLLSDVQMPGLSGTKICKMLKESVKNLKIALFSNLPDRDLARMSNESMADAWISKNTKPDEWLEKIIELVGPPN